MHSIMTLASAVVLFALAAIPSPEATAQGVRFARTTDQLGARPAKMYHQAKAKQPGGCGTYMYWKKGKCNDARNKT
jgi:hypothetical protein